MRVARQVEVPFRIRFEECQPDGSIRPSTYLRLAQDAAWVHSTLAGFDRGWYGERGLAWVVRCLSLEVHGAGRSGDEVTLTTEVIALRRVLARRRGTVRGADRELLAIVETDWLMTGPGLRPVRIPTEIETTFPTIADTFEPARVTLPSPAADARRRRFRVRRSELDPMDHVNNAAYLDYVEESLAEAGREAALARRPRRYELEYLAAAEPGAALEGTLWPAGRGWAYRLTGASGVGSGDAEAGGELLRATLQPVSPEGSVPRGGNVAS